MGWRIDQAYGVAPLLAVQRFCSCVVSIRIEGGVATVILWALPLALALAFVLSFDPGPLA